MFQDEPTKPVQIFLHMPFILARMALQKARRTDTFPHQAMFLAERALDMVVRLNDLVDVEEGPSAEQLDIGIDITMSVAFFHICCER